jgi:hypothetical protein
MSTSTLTTSGDLATDKPSAAVVSVTPEIAARWLSKNLRNRNVRAAVVDSYARDMKAGRWQITGEAVKFATTGELIDGQHRLHAVIKAETPVMLFVVRGLTPSAQDVMDTGSKRAASDMLALNGHKNATVTAAAARLLLHLEQQAKADTRHISRTFTNTEIAACVERNPGIESAASAAMALREIDVSPSVLAVAWMKLSAVSAPDCADFFNSLAQNATNGHGDPRNTLLKRLLAARRNGERLTQGAQLAFIVRAWNAWRKGQELTILRAKASNSRGGSVNVVIPKAI